MMKEKLIAGLRRVIPTAQDTVAEFIRKAVFLLALLAFVGSGYYLLEQLVFLPNKTRAVTETVRDIYREDGRTDNAVPDGTDTTEYPEGITDAFRSLYRKNRDIRGWLTFTAGENDLFDGAIDCPVVQGTDNDRYLKVNFLGQKDRSGTLFFDYRNDLSVQSKERNTIIYGHNLSSGLMFSRFNLLATGNLSRARQLSTLTLDTLYGETVTYQVFAVMVLNVEETDGPVFNYLRTAFIDDSDFARYLDEIRRRSIYDFGGVTVSKEDTILTLSTCSNPRDAHLKNGRIAVVARRVKDGEDPAVNTNLTVLNEDVLMPRAWYTNQNKELPAEYCE